jgi:hypothetical protein
MTQPTPFLPDLRAFHEEGRQHPSLIRVVSVEPDGDALAIEFWGNSSLTRTLSRLARVLRINSQRQPSLLREFHRQCPVSVFPSLFVFAPFSAEPSQVYAGTFPDAPEFEAVISSLEPLDAAAAPPFAPDVNVDEQPRRRTPRSAVDAAPPPSAPAERVAVSVRLPSGDVIEQTFRASSGLVAVYSWVSARIKKAYMWYSLSVVPGGEPFPMTSRVKLEQYAPELALLLVLKEGAPDADELRRQTDVGRQPDRPGWLQTVWSYLARISPFADPRGDPRDFWRTHPPTRGAA